MGTRSQHGGGNKPPFLSFLAAYNTREPSCIPHQHSFLKIGQVFKKAEGCQNSLKIHFVAYNPLVMEPNSLKIGRKISSPLYFDGIAPLTHFLESSRQLLKTIAVRLFSTTFQSLDVFARIRCVLTFVFARIRFWHLYLPIFGMSTYILRIQGRGTARSGACNDEKC